MSGHIQHHQDNFRGAFQYWLDGEKLAEMVYVMAGSERMIIDHTEVDDRLRGQGIGVLLLEALIDHVRTMNISIIPLCPFAKTTLAKHPGWQDVLAG